MNKIILALIVLATSCGYRQIEHCEKPINEKTPTTEPSNEFVVFVNPILQARCVRCHQGKAYVSSAAGFTNSRAKSLIRGRQMPPGGTPEAKAITEDERQTLLSFQ